MISSLLATKLHRPPTPAKRVLRPCLTERLNEGLKAGRRLTLVSAPAGFGKTTCISDWLDGIDVPVAWLSLDSNDDEPGLFWAYLVAALQSVDDCLGRSLSGMLESEQLPPPGALLTALINEIQAVGRRFVLVLDDFHVLHERAILSAVERLVANQPTNLHLVLVTREDPQLPLARLRGHNQVTEIRTGDLRFTDPEAERFLSELMCLPVSRADVAALQQRTEGWVAGLQLAGLSMRGRPDPSSVISGLGGSHRHILGYLTEEVLGQQSTDVQSFLLQTSILDELNGDLCEAVTGRTECGALLERLCAANLFLIPLDDDRRWYRYHHLFAHLLATRLRQELSAGEIHELHRRAGGWLAQNGLLDGAIQHALAGEAHEQAVSLVEQVARPMIFAGRVETLRRWLAALPAASHEAHPRLRAYRAWVELLQGGAGLSAECIAEQEELLHALPPSPENDQLCAELSLALIRFLPWRGNLAGAIRLGREALARLPQHDLDARARVSFALAVAYSLSESTDLADSAYRECLRLARSAGDLELAAEVTGLMAQGCFHLGQLHQAARLYRSIIDMGSGASAEPFYPAGHGYIGLGGVYLEWNDLAQAESNLERGIELCVRGGLDGIYRGYYLRARLCQAKGDLEGAGAQIDLLDQVFPREDDPLKTTRKIMILRAMGDVAGVARCALPWLGLLESALASEGAPAGGPPIVILEVVELMAIRVFLFQAEIERALGLLDRLQATAEPRGRLGLMIEVHLLRALALQQQHVAERACSAAGLAGVAPAARDSLGRSLALAEQEGHVLIFLEEGQPMVPLLRALVDDPAAAQHLRSYAFRLLAALEAGQCPRSQPAGPAPLTAAPAGRTAGAAKDLVEPLTARELEILRLIYEGCSNQEIAGRLVITLHTVKKHSSNIFAKLSVTSRTQAVARARQLGLL